MPGADRRKGFVRAYLGEAAGNATKAAILAGYSQKTARQAGSKLLTYADVQGAIQKATDKAEFTVEQSLREVAQVATATIDLTKVSAGDKVKANELFLKVKGQLKDGKSEPRVTVNIGFLNPQQAQPTYIQVSTQDDTSQLQAGTIDIEPDA